MRVLAIDASLRSTGVAIVDANNGKPRALYFGIIHNARSLRSSSCLVAIRDRLAELIHEHDPDCCALESVIYVQSYKTAIVLTGAAGKNQVAFMVRALLGLPETPAADAADALAIGLTHLRSQEAARLGVSSGVRI
ncbi:MAG: crossover junction endodeoxyribonuclease RuvC [Verrucomicrobia bacterium]|nr:MAG: crossover junction endodeoxyribonuclease RuvC [Verrucomicrobiota bacterium]